MFVADKVNPFCVIDHDRKISLSTYLRDVPRGARWFTFSIEGFEFLIESDYKESPVLVEHTFICYLEKIERRLRASEQMQGRRVPFDIVKDIVPPLREAMVALDRRRVFLPELLDHLVVIVIILDAYGNKI